MNNLNYPCEFHMLDCVDSTNNFAKSIRDFNIPQIVIAKEQTSGRGTKGRSFFSAAGKGLYMSILFKPEMSLDDIMSLTVRTGECIRSVLENYTSGELVVKPVNDVYLNGKKVCGILTEADTVGVGKFERIIVGIGINCFEQEFPDEIKDIAGWIEDPKKDFTIDELAADIINAFFALVFPNAPVPSDH